MPVPRRLDRRPPEQDLTRINERISVPEVRLIDERGNQVGVLKTAEALRYSRQHDLDLVEVAPQARPPVARVLDYSKYKYEQAQKQKQARKHQQQITIREIKFRPKIAQHDYDTKKGHVERFLLSRSKVKVTIMFRGREVAHPERGVAILDRLAGELSELAVVEQSASLEGRNMAMLLAPSKAILSGQIDSARAVAATAGGDAASDGPRPDAALSAGTPDGRVSSDGDGDGAAEQGGEPETGGEAEAGKAEAVAPVAQPEAGSSEPDSGSGAPDGSQPSGDGRPPRKRAARTAAA